MQRGEGYSRIGIAIAKKPATQLPLKVKEHTKTEESRKEGADALTVVE